MIENFETNFQPVARLPPFSEARGTPPILVDTLKRELDARRFLLLTVHANFCCRRETLKQTIAGERMGKEKSRKAGTFLCAKKNLKKKRKKSPYHTYQDGGYPLYSSSSTDGEPQNYSECKSSYFVRLSLFSNDAMKHSRRIRWRGDSHL